MSDTILTTKTLIWQVDVTFNGNKAETEDFIRVMEAIELTSFVGPRQRRDISQMVDAIAS